ncbi:hypothetical protein MASR2M18_01090 [Ignavibacteria bacterium]
MSGVGDSRSLEFDTRDKQNQWLITKKRNRINSTKALQNYEKIDRKPEIRNRDNLCLRCVLKDCIKKKYF